MPRILLVGSGITTAVTSSLLRQELPIAELVVWDKARGTGGRMTTHRNSEDGVSTVDLGVQYISATPDYAKIHGLFYGELQSSGILAPLLSSVGGMRDPTPGTKHYVTPKGSSSLVKHFLNKATSDIKFGHHLTEVNESIGSQWEVKSSHGVTDTFDIVVLTMPVPQILGIAGKIKELIESNDILHHNLKSVQYSSRYALGLFYSKDAEVSLPEGNSAAYISNDPVIRFVAIDNLKRSVDNVGPSVVIQTSVPFGKAHIDKLPTEVEPSLVAKVSEMFPNWPKPIAVKCHKWRYSQVSSAFPGLPGVVKIGDGLIAGGDGFTHSNMDGCIESAKAVAESVLQYIRTKNV